MKDRKKSRRAVGKEQEDKAARYLTSLGYEILERNFYSRTGEIDLIVRDGAYLVFVEVKYRKNFSCGEPSEAVGPGKIRSIIKTARYYLYKKGLGVEIPCRFDVVSIAGDQVTLLQNAFDAEGR